MIYIKRELQDLLWGESDYLEVIEDKIIDTGRWSIHHSLVFKDKKAGSYYQTTYSVGATEQQDESPFEYDPEEIECKAVSPIKKEITVYE